MQSIVERIGEFVAKKGISMRSFEKSIGVSNGAIGNAIKKKADIGSSVVSKIIEIYPEINPNWLLTGSLGTTWQYTSKETEDFSIGKEIPLIPIEAFAGYAPEQYQDIPVEDTYHITEFNDADFLIRVKGDSMTPRFNGGDIVACKKIYELLYFQWHRIYVIYTKSQGVMIKRVEQSENASCIKLVSDNPNYHPFEIPKDDISDIALVMGAITLE